MISVKLILISLVMRHTYARRNLTGLMMTMTGGVGCDENEHFSLHPKNAICCEEDLEINSDKRLAPNVCWEPRIIKSTRPGCMCNKGFDLNYGEENQLVWGVTLLSVWGRSFRGRSFPISRKSKKDHVAVQNENEGSCQPFDVCPEIIAKKHRSDRTFFEKLFGNSAISSIHYVKFGKILSAILMLILIF